MSEATPLLLEASWEVCNKAGGIYTVVTSKLGEVQKNFPGRYFPIGPKLPQAPQPTFAEEPLPEALLAVAEMIESQGVKTHYGRWLVPHEPKVILLSWEGLLHQLNDYKARLWEEFALDTLGSNFYETDEPLLWSIAVALFIETYQQVYPEQKLIFHGQEWMTAGTFMHLKSQNAPLRTVFTAHATVLGRTRATRNLLLPTEPIDADQEAKNYNVWIKHQLEKKAATLTDRFLVVSSSTAREAECYLGKKPDLITENGLDLSLFPTGPALESARSQASALLDKLVSAFFAPYLPKKAFYQFSMGRFEMHNKGYDFYLQALGALNALLKKIAFPKDVIAFFLVPSDPLGPLEHYDPHFPSPFQLRQGEADPLIQTARECGLTHQEIDPVKIIYLPVYLDGQDGLLNRPLYEIIPGFDLGVFPSFYEPWGYTPMESLALGVPAVTTALSGFGTSLLEHATSSPSVSVLNREQDPSAALAELVDYLHQALQKMPAGGSAAQQVVQPYSWEELYATYLKAYYD